MIMEARRRPDLLLGRVTLLSILCVLRGTQVQAVSVLDLCWNAAGEQGTCSAPSACAASVRETQTPEESAFARRSSLADSGCLDRSHVCCVNNTAVDSDDNDNNENVTVTEVVDRPTSLVNRVLLELGSCGQNFPESNLKMHPWIALVKINPGDSAIGPMLLCTGTLISKKHVVTSASCVYGNSIESVRLGEFDPRKSEDCIENECNPEPQDFTVNKTQIYYAYESNLPGIHHNIAILHLAEEVAITDYVRPICLPLDDMVFEEFLGQKLTTINWGNSTEVVEMKHSLTVPVVENKHCAALVDINGETELCAGEAKKYACQAGSPLMSFDTIEGEQRWFLVGITSFADRNCGRDGTPTVFTRIGYYVDWLKININSLLN